MMKKILLTITLACLSNSSFSAEFPVTAGKDNRVTTVNYDENNVVEIQAKPGVVTHIVLQKGETHEAHAFGDGDAWHFSDYKNNLYIKPAQPNGTTNLSVITNKRDYMFKIQFLPETAPGEMYQVRFNYPDDITSSNSANSQKETEKRFENAKIKKLYNLQYSMRGNQTIAPINVYDDGTFTYFKFPGNVDLPTIYAVTNEGKNKYGQEMLVNKSITGQGNSTIVMHKVHAWWRLRLGDAVLDIQNDGMNWLGVLNKTGTVAPDVERVEVED